MRIPGAFPTAFLLAALGWSAQSDVPRVIPHPQIEIDAPIAVDEAWNVLDDQKGKKVILGAADTFRAAAVDQLETWAQRLDIPIISGQMGGDSAAVAFDTVQSAVNRKFDIALIDTAGRLHTRFNLMEELKKVHRVVGKAMRGAPHAVWLVMDATTGQHALQQARAFKDAVKVNGVILAKLDSSARGGMAFAIQRELGLPILYAGLGEKPDDLTRFDREAFVNGLLAKNQSPA